jgi:hypothetical protein
MSTGTIRTETEILNLFADNNTGDISEQDLRDFVCSIYDETGTATELAKVSADDTTANFLENKIVAGTNITVTTLSPGGNETFEISASGGGGSGGTVQGSDGTYDIQATAEGVTAGNARGENSVDLQTNRAAANQVAAGTNSVISGGRNNKIASTFANDTTISGGVSNYCNGYFATIGGGSGNIAYGYYSTVVGGENNESNGQWDVTGGYNCTTSALSDGCLVVGENIGLTGSATSVAFGSNTAQTGHFAFAHGFATSVDGDYSFALCRGTTPIGSTTSYVNGDHSWAMGNAVTITAAADYSHAQGLTVSCTGKYAFAHGLLVDCLASGAVAFGNTNSNSGNYAFANGINHTIGGFGHYATCIGIATDTDIAAAFVHGGGRIETGASNDGSAQAVQYIVHGVTTDATQTELLTVNGGGSRRLELPDDSTWAFEALITARRTDANDESAAYRIFGCIDRNSGVATTALVGSLVEDIIEDTAAWDVDINADTTNGALRVQVTGEAAKNIRWVATIRTTQTFG